MKKQMTVSISMMACIALALIFTGIARSQGKGPTEMMKGVVGEVFHTLQTYPVDGPAENNHLRRDAIRKIIDANFDSIEMSRRALGPYWKEISEDQQRQFTQLFYWRLYNFYILRVEAYSDEKVLYNKEILKGNVAAVYTQVSSKKYPEFDIEYRLKQEGENWKIYDVVIEGVSLVANYRSQFSSFLSKKSFEELLKALREKNPEDPMR
ncbi:MAG: ABC transporter substrate-binding protein [Deltaproteobacteria bacterium]|nr:ABC transporter substrate-binding protein [Deltaproteobacteria bacterium]